MRRYFEPAFCALLDALAQCFDRFFTKCQSFTENMSNSIHSDFECFGITYDFDSRTTYMWTCVDY